MSDDAMLNLSFLKHSSMYIQTKPSYVNPIL